jgi:DNA polymerase IV
MPSVCRDCATLYDSKSRCIKCNSPSILNHPELYTLSIAHMDCDAFYASVEKRDNPTLADKPVIIGGGTRGVVSTACYIARIKGVRSAMPMFQALKKCPEAIVIKPRMEVYSNISKSIKQMMTELTPAVEPLSLDEAFLDLTGTEKLHGSPPVVQLCILLKRISNELGITGSIGLSHNKFLAKIASDLEKPKGFSIIGLEETEAFLSEKPVKLIWGVGTTFQEKLENDGIRKFSDIKSRTQEELMKRYGQAGLKLWHLARGQDPRKISASAPVKSISNETTFYEDTSDRHLLDGHIWRLSEKIADRAKATNRTGSVVSIKLKRKDHSQLTRRLSLREPTQMCSLIYQSAKSLLDKIEDKGPFRLIGVNLSKITHSYTEYEYNDLIDFVGKNSINVERATDKIRKKFGKNAILRGRSLR